MKKFQKISIVLLVLAMLVAGFVACATPSPESELTGTWRGSSTGAKQITMMLKSDKSFSIETIYNDDSSTVFSGTWVADSKKITLNITSPADQAEKMLCDYTLSGKNLSVDFGYGLVVLEKM